VKRPTLKHRLEYLGFRAVSGGVRLLPETLALAIGEGLGWLAGVVIRIRRREVDRNLARAFPELPEGERARIARRCYRHVGREGLAMFRLSHEGPERILARTEVVGLEPVRAALEEGKGLVLISGHVGNWEVGGAVLAALGLPLEVVVQIQRNPLFNRELIRSRERMGMRLIPRGEAVRRGLRALREGRVLALAADQNAGRGGVFVDFFGVPASTARGPALFAIRSGAPVFFMGVVRLPGPGGRYRLTLEPVPVDRSADSDAETVRLTAAHTALLQRYIQAAPEQYFWLHRRWKTRPPEPSRDQDV
jgi:Kdo2-lipid IVA lauroyltransferase/acyltransferase